MDSNNSGSEYRGNAPGDSTLWSAERKRQAGQTAAKRLAQLRATPAWRAKMRRSTVASHLAMLVAAAGLPKAKVAERAAMKPAQLSRLLSGEPNLTLDTISRICEATGYDFDLVFRHAGEQAALQLWQRPSSSASVLEALMRNLKSAFAAAADTTAPLRGCYDISLAGQEAANQPRIDQDCFDGLAAAA